MVTEDPGRPRRVPEKALESKLPGVTELPRVSEVSGVFAKASAPIDATELPRVTDVSSVSLKVS